VAPKSRQGGAQRQVVPPRAVDRRAGASDDFARLLQANTVQTGARGRSRRRSPLLGKVSLGIAIVCAAVDGSAFAVFMGGEMGFATGISLIVVFLTLVAALLGFIAAVGGLGRWYGVVAVLTAFVANPVVLMMVLVVVAPEAVGQFGAAAS